MSWCSQKYLSRLQDELTSLDNPTSKSHYLHDRKYLSLGIKSEPTEENPDGIVGRMVTMGSTFPASCQVTVAMLGYTPGGLRPGDDCCVSIQDPLKVWSRSDERTIQIADFISNGVGIFYGTRVRMREFVDGHFMQCSSPDDDKSVEPAGVSNIRRELGGVRCHSVIPMGDIPAKFTQGDKTEDGWLNVSVHFRLIENQSTIGAELP